MTSMLAQGLTSVWLEVTGRCQLSCTHCYASSGPAGTHGTMTAADWTRVVDEAAVMGARLVQLIGGEPTLHPGLSMLVGHGVARGLAVEVCTNLVRVPEDLWATFALPGVSLATSYYSAVPEVHDRITGRRSHRRTQAGIAEAVRRGIPIRVGVVEVEENQRVHDAVAELRALGVDEVRVDRLRQVGRGVRDRRPEVDQLCGRCADGVLAITPSGDVVPCVFARWLVLGNVHTTGLGEIATRSAPARMELRARLSAARADKCLPKTYGPQCIPSFEKPRCDPDRGDGCDPRNKPQ